MLRRRRRNLDSNDGRLFHLEAEKIDRACLDLAGLGPDDHLGIDGLQEDEDVRGKVVPAVLQHQVASDGAAVPDASVRHLEIHF